MQHDGSEKALVVFWESIGKVFHCMHCRFKGGGVAFSQHKTSTVTQAVGRCRNGRQ